MSREKPVKGGAWEIGAISNASWTGVKLRDVLIYLGVDPDSTTLQHVQFEGLDRDFEKAYAASIPFEKAISKTGDVLLAFEMNGKELPKDHGYPLRVVAPGIVGARNVKWVHKVHASREESQGHWQQNDYKGFSPSVDWHNVDWKSAPAIQELPVQSAITEPSSGLKISEGTESVSVKGYAWSGGGRGIVRVDVTADGGKTWHTAELQKPNQPYNRVWSWTLWTADIPVPKDVKGDFKICVKATDSSYNTQPEKVAHIWNLRGVLCNSWHCINVQKNPK